MVYNKYRTTRQLLLVNASMEIPSYVTGLADGEGCFSVSFSKRKKMTLGIEVRPSFAVSQHQRNKDIIFFLQQFFSCGGVRYSRSDQNYKYEVRSLSDLITKVIPHFDNYPLQTSKKKDYLIFRQICELMKKNFHRQPSGLRKIINLAHTMNEAGERRYSSRNLLQMINKMKV